MEVRLIDKGITVAEDYIAGTVYVEYDNMIAFSHLKTEL